MHDPQVGGDEAFRMLIPKGWKTSGGVRWMPDRSNLAAVAMRIFSPHGVEAHENSFEGRDVDLPSGHGEAWVFSSGEHALSNDPSFNPNVGSTIEWRRMKLRK